MEDDQTIKKERELILENQKLRNQLNETKKSFSEELTFYKSLLQNSRDVTVRWNFQTKTYEYVSPSVQTLVGYSRDEFLNMDLNTALTMVHPDDIPALQAAFKLSEEQGSADSEYRQKNKNGEYIWISNRMFVVNDINGHPLYRISNLRDISEQKKIDERLQEINENLVFALAATELGTWDFDLATGIANHSLRHDQIFGFSELQTEWSYEISIEHMLPEFHNVAREAVDNALKTGKLYFEAKVKWPDESIHWIAVTGRVKYNDKGDSAKLAGVVADITGRKLSEVNLLNSENLFRSLAENIPQLCWMTNADGWIFWYNKRWYDYTGTTYEQMEGWGWKSVHHPDHVERVLNNWTNALKSKESWEDTFPLRNSMGQYRWFLSRAFPIRDERGEIIHWFGTNTDITDHVKAEQRAQASQEVSKGLVRSITAKQVGDVILGEAIRAFGANAAMLVILIEDTQELETLSSFGVSENIKPDWKRYPLSRKSLATEVVRTGQAILLPSMSDILAVNPDGASYLRELGVEAEAAAPLKIGARVLGAILFGFGSPQEFSPFDMEFLMTITSQTAEALERIRLYSEVERQEKNYKELITNARSIILKTDTAGRFTYFNEYGLKFFGYREEEIIGKDAVGTIVPEIESTGRDLTDMSENLYRDPDKFEVNINENIKKNGERIWIEWHNKALFNEEGTRLGHIAVGIDITKRKKAEDMFVESQRKLNLALENANIGIWEWDLKTNELIWDERTEKIFGFAPGTFDRKYATFESCIHEDDLAHLRDSIDKTLKSGTPLEIIYRIKNVNGATNYISARANLKKDKSGDPVNLAGVIFDITGMREGTEHTILKLNEELMRSNNDLQQFAYVASHDLQEPLRMVHSFTQLLAQRYQGKLDQDALDYINFAVDGSKRMYDLLNGLLSYSRVQAKGREFASVDMNSVIEKVTGNLSLRIKEKEAIIHIKKLPVIIADEAQMIQVFQNLVENALKFSKGTPKISISSKTDSDNYAFFVKDNGIGIDSQYFERIFQIFQRLHTKEEYSGIGIGLSICKKIIERHGGRIWVESEISKGTTFYFSIPKKPRQIRIGRI